MTAVVLPAGPGAFARAADVVRRGGLVIYPTDTVYGLGCDPFNEDAVARLFTAKGRKSKPVSVLCSERGKAEGLVILNDRARKLAVEHWPGALTIVAPLRRALPRLLTQGSPNLGVRVPASEVCRRIIEACGGYLTGTSANVSGLPSARTAADALAQLGEAVELVVDGGFLGGQESTVVQAVGDSVAILRTGPVGVADAVKGRRTS